MIALRTRRTRKERINHENLLKMSSAASQQVEVVSNSRFDIDTVNQSFTISCILSKRDTAQNISVFFRRGVFRLSYGISSQVNQAVGLSWGNGGQNSLIWRLQGSHVIGNNPDGLVFIAVRFDHVTRKAQAMINGVFARNNDDPSMDYFDVDNIAIYSKNPFPSTLGSGVIQFNFSPNVYSDFLYSNFIWSTKAEDDQTLISWGQNGGVPPPVSHANIILHLFPAQRYYFKADAAFVAKHSRFMVNDLVAWDVVEQYNYARKAAIANFSNWSSPLNPAFSISGNQLSYNGSSAVMASHTHTITNPYGFGVYKVKFNVTSITGSGGHVFIGAGSTPTTARYNFTSPGLKEIYLSYGLGSPQIAFANSPGITATWTVEDVEIIPLSPLHAKLINFSEDEVGIGENPSSGIFNVRTKSKSREVGISNLFNTLKRVANGNPDNFEFRSSNNLGDASTGVLRSGSSFTMSCIASFPDAALNFGGGGQILSGINTSTVFFTLRNPGFFRVRFDGGVTTARDFPISAFSDGRNRNRLWIVIARFDNATLDIDYYFKFLDSDSVKKLMITSPTSWSRPNNSTYGLSFYSLVVNSWIVSSEKQSDAIVDQMLNLEFDNVTAKIIDASVNNNPSLVLNDKGTSNLDFRLQTIDLNPPPLTEQLLLETGSGLPEIKEALTINGVGQYVDLGNTLPAPTDGYSLTFGFIFDKDLFNANGEIVIRRRLSASRVFQLLGDSASRAVRLDIGGSEATSSNNVLFDLPQGSIHLLDYDIYLLSDGSSVIDVYYFGRLVNSMALSGPGRVIDQSLYNTPLLVGSGVSTFETDIKPFLFSFSAKRKAQREMLKLANNMAFRNLPLDKVHQVHYLNFNRDAFTEDGTNVLIKNHGSEPAGKVLGYAGATTSDQLTDLQSKSVSINTFR
ncbi:hypothetical protein FNH22_30550 [Fulvivirga sp. M361]|uniref:hypothetical protein n=1 Tax=Fulvivirga sp. M361 TaxID=2594266 RepID=UPI00117AC28F|nr:hypothetical protein [Fulvivirga sp. M361]TRX47101.1 hypothetical protein FNH22_30550 [Fulvivirga sp. M361]